MVYYNLPRQTRGFRSLRFIRTPSFVSTGNSSLDVITSLVSIFFAVSFSNKVNEVISIRFSFIFVENIEIFFCGSGVLIVSLWFRQYVLIRSSGVSDFILLLK